MFRWSLSEIIHKVLLSGPGTQQLHENSSCPHYCYSNNTRGENWNNNILTQPVTVSHLGNLSNCQAWFRGSSTHLQSRTIITEAEPQRPTLLSSQFYLGESLNSMTYKEKRCLNGMENRDVTSWFLSFPYLLGVRVTQLFSGWQSWQPTGGCFPTGITTREGPGRSSREKQFCSLVNLLKPKVWIISITVHIPGYPLLIECLQWQGTHHLPQSSLFRFG